MTQRLIACIFLLLAVPAIPAWAQEVLLPLEANPVKEALPLPHKSGEQPTALSLPFWDDFSYQGPYPDSRLWADRQVFVNNSFAIHPRTWGTATFDALDEHGQMYPHIEPTNTPYVADRLTSQPIRLDSVMIPSARALSPADSVIISFFYQPQGRSGPPTPDDALKLEFLHTPGYWDLDGEGEVVWVEDLWETVWETEGMSLSEFSSDTFPWFRRVALPVTDPVYFRKDFRFRFTAMLSYPPSSGQSLDNLASSRAVWHVDYVTLGHNRRRQEESDYDIAFAGPAQSLLREYSAMPWSHYILNPQQHLREDFEMLITNLDNTVYPYSYRYFIRDEAGQIVRNYSGGTWNLQPFSTHGYQAYQPHARPIVIPNPLPTAPAEKRHFDIVHVVRAGAAGDDRPRNDTLVYRQHFDNHFAYDDGVPEQGYGLTGWNPRLAYRFTGSKADELGAVQIYFNRTIGSQNKDRAFRFTVWESLHPEEIILYQSEEVVLSDYADGLNAFVTYVLDQAVPVPETFYVGLAQQGRIDIPDFLSIGFDWSRDASDKLFYNVQGEWMPSIYPGALMIRPVMGAPRLPTTATEPGSQLPLSVYPNPAGGNYLRVSLGAGEEDDGLYRMEAFDLYGRMVFRGDYTPTLPLESFSNGVYILRITHAVSRQSGVVRFVVAR
jgi:hypothetical protein